MVKNKKGGSKHKKQASKNNSSSFIKTKLRLAKEEGEIYCRVTKLLGNGMCDVMCNDKITRLLIIRKKFKGRNRRDNQVGVGSVILAGLRTWSVSATKKKQKADLLCVYSDHHITELKHLEDFNARILLPENSIMSKSAGNFDFVSKSAWKQEAEEEGEEGEEGDKIIENKVIFKKELDFDISDI